MALLIRTVRFNRTRMRWSRCVEDAKGSRRRLGCHGRAAAELTTREEVAGVVVGGNKQQR